MGKIDAAINPTLNRNDILSNAIRNKKKFDPVNILNVEFSQIKSLKIRFNDGVIITVFNTVLVGWLVGWLVVSCGVSKMTTKIYATKLVSEFWHQKWKLVMIHNISSPHDSSNQFCYYYNEILDITNGRIYAHVLDSYRVLMT